MPTSSSDAPRAEARQADRLDRADRAARAVAIGGGVAVIALGLGYFAGLPYAAASWPWSESPFDFLLVSAFLVAAGAVLVWLGTTGEWGAAKAATANVGAMNAGAAIFLGARFAATRDARLLVRAIAFAVFAAANLAVFLWSRRHPIRDVRPAPRPVRVASAVYAAVLAVAATELLRRSETIFPWALEATTETMFGWLFLGSAIYFAAGVGATRWHEVRGQLLAFLAYDLVLVVPYLAMFDGVYRDHLASLVVYVSVIIGSALFSAYYLFVHRATRGWAVVTGEAPAPTT
jgi:hypothetical protein